MEIANEAQIQNIGKVLLDPTRPLKQRFRALFTLTNIGGAASIQCISECFKDSSALLKHELAYCLGQMQEPEANAILIEILEDTKQEVMVRHEAAEALGALGFKESTAVLEKYKNDPAIEVAQTCELALERMKWLHGPESDKFKFSSPHTSIDPAPPATDKDIAALKAALLDDAAPLFDRYRAMFALRNIHTPEAVAVLGAGLKCGSALFRHEIAFVLGQMQDRNSVGFLVEALEDGNENEMVRHECAEALGAIATDDCIAVLNKYLRDDKRVVKESCEVALDMCEYENSPEFQYANALQDQAVTEKIKD